MTDSPPNAPARIAGLPILKGLVLYAATLTFAGLYAYFMAKIATADHAVKPEFSTVMISAAAALAGVLGSAFALYIGVPTSPDSVNSDLGKQLEKVKEDNLRFHQRWQAYVRRVLSIDPPRPESASWPITFGIWAYALVAGAVSVTYVVNQSETPDAIKALALAFSGYVVAFMTSAFGVGRGST